MLCNAHLHDEWNHARWFKCIAQPEHNTIQHDDDAGWCCALGIDFEKLDFLKPKKKNGWSVIW